MTLHRLDNAQWGFASNCFVCERSNPSGLQISFVHDDEADLVRATFNLGEVFSGAPSYVHGGLVLAIMDEAMAWASIALAHTWALTRQTSATFVRPIRTGQPHEVVARLTGVGADATLELAAEVVWLAGEAEPELCAQAHATFAALSADSANRAIGGTTGPDHATYLRARHPFQ